MTIAIDERSIAPPTVTPASLIPAPRTARAAGAMPSQFLSFRLGDEEYGIDILRVQEIRSYEAPTRVAGSPPFVKGVVNLRGLIVPIVDLRMTMGCPSAAYTDFTVVIVLNVGRRVIGAVVDSVSDVLALAPADIKPVPEMSSSMDAAYMMGIGCIRSGGVDRMLILTDIDAMMGSAEMGLIDADLH
jgi:purine-binding chemotaxis protein CheW